MKLIGVIAEDSSDVETLDELISKIAVGRRYAIRKFVGHGCGKMLGKCRPWAENLKKQGCNILLVVHDLDARELESLRKTLISALNPSPISQYLVVIPVREIEAWLLADSTAIKKAMNIKATLPRIANPESIEHPKEFLERLILAKSGKSKCYLNSIHNRRIAAEADISQIRRCSSFQPLESFLLGQLTC